MNGLAIQVASKVTAVLVVMDLAQILPGVTCWSANSGIGLVQIVPRGTTTVGCLIGAQATPSGVGLLGGSGSALVVLRWAVKGSEVLQIHMYPGFLVNMLVIMPRQ